MKLRSLIALVIGMAALATLSSQLAASKTVLAQSLNRAAVVVSLDQERIESACVAFEEESISGLDLLTRSGLDLVLRVEGFGSAVCSIEDSGCAADDCFCQCKGGGDCVYWSYWHQKDSGWEYAAAGASSYRIKDGDIDGWTWGPGSPNNAIEPPTIPFEELCNPEALLLTAANRPQETSSRSLEGLAAFSGITLLLLVILMRFRRIGVKQ